MTGTNDNNADDGFSEKNLNDIIFNAAPEGVFCIGPDIRYAAVNPRAAELTGYPREELIGMDASVIHFPDDVAEFRTRLESLCGAAIFTQEMRIRRKDGSILDAEVSTRPLPDGSLLATMRDITDRKRLEESLRSSEARYRALVESQVDLISRYRPDTTLTFVNDAYCRFFGKTREELIGRSFLFIVTPEFHETVRRESLDMTHDPRPLSGEYLNSKPDGSQCWIQWVVHGITGENGNVVELQAVGRDITQRKKNEEERQQLQSQLHQAQKMESVGRLAGGVAHDFNNMLTAILGHAQLGKAKVAPSERVHADLQAIEQASIRSAALVRQLLTFARKQAISPVILDLNKTIEGMFGMLARLIGEDIEFTWTPSDGLWLVKIDPSQVDQLLANLCVNARDAIAGVGSIAVASENAIVDRAFCACHAGAQPGEYVRLSVSDNGCGMAKEVLAHLFEPFFTTKEIGKGTGLGLATVYGIVNQNGGFIVVDSAPGKGSAFSMYLPRFVGEVADGPRDADSSGSPQGGGETILLVEDEEAILRMGKIMLEELGYNVLTAGTPREAMDLTRERAGEIRLLLTDMIMPDMNGRDLAKSLVKIAPGLKCLYSSGYAVEAIADHGIMNGQFPFIQKPYTRNELAAKIRDVLNN